MSTREINYPNAGVVPYMNLSARMSWGAVFAGSFVASAVFLSLTMLGAGIGLIAAPGAQGQAMGIAAAAYGAVSALIAFYCGGWIAGRLTAYGRPADSVIHGVVCWSVTVLFSVFLIGSAVGKAFSGLAGIVGGAAEQAGAAAAQSAQQGGGDAGGAIDRIEGQAQDLRRALDRRIGNDDPNRTDVPRDQIRQTGETAAKAAGAVGLGGAALMLLELLACALGARMGTRVYRFTGRTAVDMPEREIAQV